MKISTYRPQCLPLSPDTINDLAAIECSRAMAELLIPGASIARIFVGHPKLLGAIKEKTIAFEVGFGAPGMDLQCSQLTLSALKDLFSGKTLEDTPLFLPTEPHGTPLAAARALSFPILIRGTIASSNLQMNSDYSSLVGYTLPYREALGRLQALNVHEIQLYLPTINQESDEDYQEQAADQLQDRMNMLRELFLPRGLYDTPQ